MKTTTCKRKNYTWIVPAIGFGVLLGVVLIFYKTVFIRSFSVPSPVYSETLTYKNVEFMIPNDYRYAEFKKEKQLFIKYPLSLRYEEETFPMTQENNDPKRIEEFKIEFSDDDFQRSYDKSTVVKNYKTGSIEGIYTQGFIQEIEFSYIEDTFSFPNPDGTSTIIHMGFLYNENFRSTPQYKYAKKVFDRIIETLTYTD